MTDLQKHYMQMAIDLGKEGMETGKGGPFGCVIVKDEKVIGKGCNNVLKTIDPTAHAEVVAIREACKTLENFQLDNCEIYASCEPCPMCLGAIFWARPARVFYAGTKEDAADAGFDDEFIYREIELKPSDRKIPMLAMMRGEAQKVFEIWKNLEDKTLY